MGEVSTIGLDIAKSVFQVHGVDIAGAVVIRKRVNRAKVLEYFGELPPCLIGIEACPSAHHWDRELQGLGHRVRLIPPSYVKAYLKRGKNDANDATAICEAVTRPSMRFVPIKTKEQQTALMLHRARQLLVRQLAWQYGSIAAEIASIDKSIMALHRACEASRRLAEIPGMGPVGATALVAEIGDWNTFSSGRSLAAWIGLVPKQHTTGGKDRLGSITKQGNRYLRWLRVVGAMAVIRYARKHGTQRRPWLGRLMERRPTKVAAVALANKITRMAWAKASSPSPSSNLSLRKSSNNWSGPVAELVGIEVGVVCGVMNLESSGVEASDWRLRHDQGYHEA